jgi:hypothetical protein
MARLIKGALCRPIGTVEPSCWFQMQDSIVTRVVTRESRSLFVVVHIIFEMMAGCWETIERCLYRYREHRVFDMSLALLYIKGPSAFFTKWPMLLVLKMFSVRFSKHVSSRKPSFAGKDSSRSVPNAWNLIGQNPITFFPTSHPSLTRTTPWSQSNFSRLAFLLSPSPSPICFR